MNTPTEDLWIGYRTFFEVLRKLAKFKLGEESRLDYGKVPEKLREFIDGLRKSKLDTL